MKPITAWGSAIVGGVTGAATAAVISLIISRPAVWTGLVGISAGEWLQSVAAIIGVGLTVQGTLWLEERKRRQDRAQAQQLLRSSLQMASHIVDTIQQPLDDATPLTSRKLTTAAHYELLWSVRDSIEYAHSNYKVDNYNLWSALNGLHIDFAVSASMLQREENLMRGNHVTEDVLAISRREVEDFAAQIAAPIRAATAALN